MTDKLETHIFEWTPGSAANAPLHRAHPLALVARALEIASYLEGDPGNRCEQPAGWIVMGITGALSGLVKHGEYDAAGLLLQALEEICESQNRARWPLSEWWAAELQEAFLRRSA